MEEKEILNMFANGERRTHTQTQTQEARQFVRRTKSRTIINNVNES